MVNGKSQEQPHEDRVNQADGLCPEGRGHPPECDRPEGACLKRERVQRKPGDDFRCGARRLQSSSKVFIRIFEDRDVLEARLNLAASGRSVPERFGTATAINQ